MNEEHINLNSVKKGNVFKGFGSSLAWFSNIIGKSDDTESVDFLCDIFFNKNNQNGLHLNYVRYCIGGVEEPSLAKNFRIGGAIEAYTKDRIWDNVDRGQRYFLKKAKEYGVENFEAFSNSPPNSMTVSGSTAGSEPWVIPFIKQDITFSNNLKSNYIEEFTRYLVDVTKYLHENDGINFTSISPYNEISNMGWQKNNNQEGCYYNFFGIRGQVSRSLRKELDKQNMKEVKVACCEENSVFFGFMSLILNPFMWNSVQQFNVHRYQWGNAVGFNTYGFEDSNIFRKLIRWVLKDKPIVMSEFGLGLLNGITDSKDFQNVLLLADKIMDDFIYLRPQLWCYWQIVDTSNWGLCEVDYNDISKINFGALYQCFQNFSHFIKPGDILLELPRLRNKNLKWIGSMSEKTQQINLVILSKDYLNTTLKFNNFYHNIIISELNKNSLRCDGSGIIKSTVLDNINEIIIPSFSLVSLTLTI